MKKRTDRKTVSDVHEREHGFDTLGPEQSRSHLIKGGKSEDFPMQVPDHPTTYDEMTHEANDFMEENPELEEAVNTMHKKS